MKASTSMDELAPSGVLRLVLASRQTVIEAFGWPLYLKPATFNKICHT